MRIERLVPLALAAGLALLPTAATVAQGGKPVGGGGRATAIPAAKPQPVCLYNLGQQLAELEQILDDYTRNGWSQELQDELDALIGTGFTLAQRPSESYALESLALDGQWYAIQDEFDHQYQMSARQRAAYHANVVDDYACSLFGRGAAGRAGITLRTSLIAVIAATAATMQEEGEVDDGADDDLFGGDWPVWEPPPDPPGWLFEPGVPFDGCLTISKPINDTLSFTAFVCDLNEGGSEPEIGVGIGIRLSW